LLIVLARLVLLSLFFFASCSAAWTTINSTCPSSCLCWVHDSTLSVGNCFEETIDQDQLSEQIHSLLSSNLTYRYLTHGHLVHFGIVNTPLMHVPRSICRLTTLQILSLHNNPLIRLPDNCFTNLTALTGLSVKFSHITKLEDRVFGALPKMLVLDLCNNYITELQDRVFGGLHKLEELRLDNNNITELKDGMFDGLRMLESLRLDNNRISSIGLRTFDGLVKLKFLYLSGNNITELQDGIFNSLRILQILELNNSRISSIGLRAFEGLSKLQYLNLQTNHVTQLHDRIFEGLRMLIILDASDNRISSVSSRTFAGLSKLKALHFINNNITELHDGIFNRLRMLELLMLTNNRISSIGLHVFDGLSKLQILNLKSNHITQLNDGIFDGLRTLRKLVVSRNRISSIGPRVFGGFAMNNSLNYINLSDTRVQARVILGLRKLEKIYLNNNDITKLQNGIFDRLSMLESIHLDNNRISSIELRAFHRLSKLKGLTLRSNNITVLHDGIFDGLRMLVTLALNNNRIASIGLRVFERLSKLVFLDLQANHISQLYDEIFDGLHMIETIDVSDNRISSIGSQVFRVSAMTYSLRYVNLTHNRIQTLDSWPIYTGINQKLKIELSHNNVHRFTNTLRWEENCGIRKVHFDILLERNPITVQISDLLRGWDMDISSTWCSSPLIESYNKIINYVYFDCDCVDFIIFSLRLPLLTTDGPMCNNRTLILNQDNTVPLDQFVCELTERCPSGCRCVHRPANATLHIYCSNTNLTVLPLELPELPKSYTKYKLDFSNNRLLRRLEHRDYFINASILDVSNCSIQLVDNIKDWSDILKIPQVNLYGNKLTSFPQLITSLNITAGHLNVAGNPWDCSCDNKWMSAWLNSIAVRLTVAVVCHSPPRLYGKIIIRTKEKEFCVDPAAEASKRAWIISLSSVAGVVVVLLSVVAIFYRLRVKLYTRWKFRPFDRDECPGEDMDYDVFLCCSSLDDRPIGRRILEVVEANGYRACYHERDFMPGLIVDNIEASVTRSKRTVCLLTDNFIQRFVHALLYGCFVVCSCVYVVME